MGINPGTISGLPSHRFPTYLSSQYGDFCLIPRLQDESIGAEIPKEIIDEIGNELSAGIVTNTARVSTTLRSFMVTPLLQKIFADQLGTVSAVSDGTGTSFTGAPTKISVVAPIKKTASGTYTLKALTSTTFDVKDSSGALINSAVSSYSTGSIVTDIPGLQITVQTDAVLTPNDTCTFTVTESSTGDINTDYSDSTVDILTRYRNPAGTYFVSEYIQGATLQSMSFNLAVGGKTEETYVVESENRTLYNGNVVRAGYFAKTSDEGGSTIDLDSVGVVAGTEVPVQTKTTGFYEGDYFLKVVKKTSAGVSTLLTETTGTPTTGLYSYNPTTKVVTLGDNISSGDWYQFTFLSQAIDTTHAYSMNFQRYATLPAIMTRECPVSIEGISTATQLNFPQAITVTINFNRQRIEGIGMGDAVLYSTAGVVKISGNINVNITDLSFDKLITQGNGSAAVDEIAVNEYADYGANNDLDMIIDVKDPTDSTTTISQIVVKGLVPGNAPIAIPLGGIATKSVDYESKSGDCVLYW